MTQLALSEIRQRVGEILEGPPYFMQGTSTGGNTTTLIDTIKLLDTTLGQFWVGGHILRDLATTDRKRRISAYVNSTGTLTVPVAWSVSASVVAYEIWTLYDPVDEVEKAINRAMIRARIPEEVEFAGVADQVQYSMAAYPWLLNGRQIAGLYQRVGDTALQYSLREVPFRPSQDQDGVVLNLTEDTFTSDDTLRLLAWRSAVGAASVSPMTLGTHTVPITSDQETIEYAALLACEQLLSRPIARKLGPRSDTARKDQLSEIRAELKRFAHRFSPLLPNASLWDAPDESWGPGIGWYE